MDLIPWKSWGELSALRKGMEEMWNRFAQETGLSGSGSQWNPKVDVVETGDSFIVKAELAGMDARDIEVSLTGSVLSIRGEKSEEKEEKDHQHYYSERHYGSFKRIFRLPGVVTDQGVEAAFDRGVLTVTVPKAVSTPEKKVDIKVK